MGGAWPLVAVASRSRARGETPSQRGLPSRALPFLSVVSVFGVPVTALLPRRRAMRLVVPSAVVAAFCLENKKTKTRKSATKKERKYEKYKSRKVESTKPQPASCEVPRGSAPWPPEHLFCPLLFIRRGKRGHCPSGLCPKMPVCQKSLVGSRRDRCACPAVTAAALRATSRGESLGTRL